MHVGSIIKYEREKRGWTLLELGRRMGYNYKNDFNIKMAVHRLEKRGDIKVSILKKIAIIFDKPYEYFLDGKVETRYIKAE